MDEPISNKIQLLKNQAFKYYREKDFSASLKTWQEVLKIDPKNPMASLYLRRLQNEISQQSTPPTVEEQGEGRIVAQCVKVLIVDDSAMMCKAISRVLGQNKWIEIVATAKNGEDALKLISELNPDVVTLDLNMPGMPGITVLKHIMVNHPRPVIMLSAFTKKGATASYDCLYYGAVDFFCKPSRSAGELMKQQEELCRKVLNASQVKIDVPKRARVVRKTAKYSAQYEVADRVIAMGANEGGCSSYLKILPQLPAKIPCGILCVQSIDKNYLDNFCDYFDQCCHIRVKKAEDGELIRQGVCYFSDDTNYLKVERSARGFYCQITEKPALIQQQNVLNQLFFSVGEKYGPRGIGILLSGNGVDGVEGLQELKRMKAKTIVQEPDTCLSPQAVNAALRLKCIDQVAKVSDIAGILWHLVKKNS